MSHHAFDQRRRALRSTLLPSRCGKSGSASHSSVGSRHRVQAWRGKVLEQQAFRNGRSGRHALGRGAAKPLRAKQIASRRSRSTPPQITGHAQGRHEAVSNHSPWQSQDILQRTRRILAAVRFQNSHSHRLLRVFFLEIRFSRFSSSRSACNPNAPRVDPGRAVVVVSPGMIPSIRSLTPGSGTAFKIVADATNFAGAHFVRLHKSDSMTADARELAATFDLEKTDAGIYANPYPPIVRYERPNRSSDCRTASYFLTRYDDLVAAIQEHKAYSSDKEEGVSRRNTAPACSTNTTPRASVHDPGSVASARPVGIARLGPPPRTLALRDS